ncbi:MAG: YeeE/YedE family protein [Oligoflexia bacterium]|nr:YeeE/YedE family protein [Oligoflexia bacterium]
MIETLFAKQMLDTTGAFLLATVVGFLFGIVLERAGFGSSKKLAGVFYFKDMTVIKVMFTALITAAIGLTLLNDFQLLNLDSIYHIPTIYGAFAVGGAIFGVGFVMGGWCPGTAIVGLASGKIDALLFIIGALVGMIGFNELYPYLGFLMNWGSVGESLIYDLFYISRELFLVILILVAITLFVLAESFEKKIGTFDLSHLKSGTLKKLSTGLVAISILLLLIPHFTYIKISKEKTILNQVENAQDHIEIEEVVQKLMNQDKELLLVDIRTSEEFEEFHIKGAIHIPMSDLAKKLLSYKNQGTIVLYSNGMTHPAQARDSLFRQGIKNVLILTDGLEGFNQKILKPSSLRVDPLSEEELIKVKSWREYFLN